jgi:hypothetical protein
LDQKRLVHIFNCFWLFTDTDGQSGEANGSPVELLTQRRQNRPINFVETAMVNTKYGKTFVSDSAGDLAIATNFSEVAYTSQETVGNARSSTTTASYLVGSLFIN